MVRTRLVGAALLSMVAGSAAAQCTASKDCTESKAANVMNASWSSTAPMGEKDIVDTAVAAGQFNTLAAALKAAGLIDTLKGAGPFTVFAPTDEAFAKLPKGTVESLLKPENKDKLVAILTYHVVAGNAMAADVVKTPGWTSVNGQQLSVAVKGDQVTIEGARITKANIAASNGVIHVIDTVLIPSDKDVIETAVAAGNFKTLAAALNAAGLVETLKGKGPFTVFAPTDEAFAKLPKGTVESLLKPENKDKLTQILTCHVVSGRVFSAEALKLGTAKTLEGDSITITSAGGSAMVDNAKLVKTDINTSNGVIHVIDTVIMPK